ncbi:BrnA antitoxin family protein [Brevundimonas sp.]|uniref:BrnA antitoxin family protein n=1 Tax=Brevundimonas sp. TaxID=1871086 RepID=UPI003567094A
MRDEDIDFSDIPLVTDWSGAVRGKFYRPEKQAVTIRLDADVVDWFKGRETKYQTAVNRVLREYMLSHRKSA